MGTISEKLTYLNETKSKIKDNINLTGAGLTNQTPFRQYATDLKTALLNILNNGIDTLYNNFPKTAGTGTNISLNNTLQAPIRSVINGDTEQDGEPTPDNPQEIKSVTGLQKVPITGGTGTTPQEYEINLGKNLLNESLISNTNRGLTWSYANEKININGTTTSTYSQSNKINLTLSAGTYVFSKSTTSTASFGIWLYNQNNTLIATGTPNNAITINEEVKSFALYVEGLTSNTQYNIDINVMLEKGSNASSYSPYFTPIHLYENDQIIGTPNNWSIKRQIGSVVLDGSETVGTDGSTTTYRRYTISKSVFPNISGESALSNYFTYLNNYSSDTQHFYIGTNNLYFFLLTPTSTANDFKTWLSNNNVKIVYPLATETTEPITNTELIEDLNNFYNAKSYNGQTNISVEGDLQMILDVSAIKGDE